MTVAKGAQDFLVQCYKRSNIIVLQYLSELAIVFGRYILENFPVNNE
jgi:hypothetical protein